MKILFVLNYYYPYISGVSEYARVIAEELVKRGHSCTVVCSNHNKLPETEEINGVKVVRAPIIMKLSKGTVSPKFISLAKKYSKEADVVNLHLPMLEAKYISKSIPSKKLILSYQCDVNLPKGLFNNFIVSTMDRQHNGAFKRASKILVTTLDYAMQSRIAKNYPDKLVEAFGPIKKIIPTTKNAGDKKVIGFCGRIVEEKGINVLLEAFRIIKEKRDDVCLKIGGDYKSVAGGSVYPTLKEYIDKHGINDVEFLGKLPEEEMGAFYSSMDVFTLPSINTLEAFGLVQVEAMMCGVPVVASDLPGVKTIVQNTGMGLICKRGDAQSLADCILTVLDEPKKYIKSSEYISSIYSTEITVNKYLQVFEEAAKNEATDN